MKKAVFFLAAAMIGLAASAQNDTLFYEGFEDVNTGTQGYTTTLPDNWVAYEDNLTNYNGSDQDLTPFGKSWFVMTQNNVGNIAASVSYTMQGTACDRWMVTPQIHIEENGPYVLTFQQYGSQYGEDLSVYVSTTDNAKASFTQRLYQEYPAITFKRVVNLSAYAGQDIYLAFVSKGIDALFVGVDDITVTKTWSADSILYAGAQTVVSAPMNTNFDFEVAVMNMGYNTLTSFDIEYTVGNNAPQTFNVTGLNIAPSAYSVATVSTSYATPGDNVPINITVKNPNGSTGGANPNATSGSISLSIYDPAFVTERTTLLEHYTTAQCQYCPGGHERMKQAVTGLEDRVVWVSHHVGFGTDAMTLSESSQLVSLFGVSGAPMMQLDRNAAYSDGNSVAFGVGAAQTIHTQLTNATSTPSSMSIELTNINYNEATRQLTFSVSGEYKNTISGTAPNVTVWITEDSIIGMQVEAGVGRHTDYQHDHVLRGLVNGFWGEQIISSTAAGATYSKDYTYTLPSSWRANKCRLVAFVNDYGSGASNRKVHNATKSEYLLDHADPTAGILTVEPSVKVSTYPNPAAEKAVITAGATIRGIEVVNTLGQTVMVDNSLNCDFVELNVADMEAGVYFVTVRTDGGNATERLVVK